MILTWSVFLLPGSDICLFVFSSQAVFHSFPSSPKCFFIFRFVERTLHNGYIYSFCSSWNKMYLCSSSTFKFSDFLSSWSLFVSLRVLSLFCEKDAENFFQNCLRLSDLLLSLRTYIFQLMLSFFSPPFPYSLFLSLAALSFKEGWGEREVIC